MSIKDEFIKAIEDNVPTDDKILYKTNTVEFVDRKCIPDNYVRKKIIISWVEPKGKENKE